MTSAAIVIPCYHRPDNLMKYLPSIVKYAGDDTRIIVVNNGNDREVAQAAYRIFPEIECVYIEGYHSRADALNFALDLVSSDVIMTLDDDIEATGYFMTEMINECLKGAYVGCGYQADNWLTELNGKRQPYVELCHAATRATWAKLGPWPTEYQHFFTDVEMCLRARAMGTEILALDLPLIHCNGKTIDTIGDRDTIVMADRLIYQKRCAKYG